MFVRQRELRAHITGRIFGQSMFVRSGVQCVDTVLCHAGRVLTAAAVDRTAAGSATRVP
jgi:hypothetical protein